MLSEQSLPFQLPVCLVFMPMLQPYAAIRAAVARSVSRAGIHMCRLETAVADSEWQYWLVNSVTHADFVLADVTDNNPFVMYELGVAHAQKLPVTLIVNAANQRVPATVLGTPFLPYDETALMPFEGALVANLKDCVCATTSKKFNVVENMLIDQHSHYFEKALHLLDRFNTETSANVTPVAQSEFSTRLMVATHRGDLILNVHEKKQIARYLLTRIITNSDEVRVMQAVEGWVNSNN